MCKEASLKAEHCLQELSKASNSVWEGFIGA